MIEIKEVFDLMLFGKLQIENLQDSHRISANPC